MKDNLSIVDPPVVQAIPNLSAIEGSEFSYSCPFNTGNPSETRVKWIGKNDEILSSNEHLLLRSVNHTTDERTYTCVAENTMQSTGSSPQLGTSSNSFQLTVNCKKLKRTN